MTRWFVDEGVEIADHVCSHCGQLLAWVDEVGWVAVGRGDAYDFCDTDPYGNHLAVLIEPAKSDTQPQAPA